VTRLKKVIKKVNNNQTKKESPHVNLNEIEDEGEPEGKTSLIKRRHPFYNIPEEKWNDWIWQFRNRITTIWTAQMIKNTTSS